MKKAIREEVWNKFNKKCAYCGNKLEYKKMQVDHFYPKAFPNIALIEGGMEHINHIDNLMPSCGRCNHYKRADRPETFRESMKTLHERIEKNYINKVGIDYGIIKIKPFDGVFYFEKLK